KFTPPSSKKVVNMERRHFFRTLVAKLPIGALVLSHQVSPKERAVPRGAQDKMREVVSVKDFGAVGDGVTDDTQARDAATVYCAASGKALFIPAGTYRFTTQWA